MFNGKLPFDLTWRQIGTLALGGLGFGALLLVLILGVNAIGVDTMRQLVDEAGIIAPLVFIAIKAVTFTFAPLTSGPIQLSAGLLFGIIPGTIYTVVGEVIGGSVSFAIARRFGHRVVQRMVGEEGMQRVDDFLEQIVDWRSIVYARLFLFSVYDFLSYAIGFSHVPYRTYFVISATVGAIPAFLSVLLGASLTEDPGRIFLIYGIIGVVSLVPLLLAGRARRLFGLRERRGASDADAADSAPAVTDLKTPASPTHTSTVTGTATKEE